MVVARLVLCTSLLSAAALRAQPADDTPPAVQREFRGVWVATVGNIDWPSRRGLTTWQQQLELLEILNRTAELGLNAVVFQVRPAADALYPSRYEPWSAYLTGEMGLAPEPFYDPLAFAVEEAHKRGLELHAWFNPYRARHPSDTSRITANHLSRTHPEVVKTYGHYLWMDPGEPLVQDYSAKVILDVVRRYDIDGVHIDDYFYPYKETDASGRVLDFPDDASWSRYVRRGGTLDRDDWRRHNVDVFIERLYRGIKAVKPWVKFGVSPFGIWRPGNPPQITGFDAYNELYADSRKWLRNGWLDYLSPQLYWPIAPPAQSYPVLLKWWVDQNEQGRHIWPGNYTGRVLGTDRHWEPGEILDQIQATRAQPGATGNVHFSMKALLVTPNGIGDQLRAGPYALPALVPASPWLDARRPAKPIAAWVVDSNTAAAVLDLRPAAHERPWLWVVQAKVDTGWTTTILPATERRHTLATSSATPPTLVSVFAVSRTRVAGPAVVLHRIQVRKEGRR